MITTIEYISTYIRDGYRLMQIAKPIDIIRCRGTIDECIAAREALLVSGESYASFYFQAHYPVGHPEYPNAGGCWVMYDLITGR